MIKEKEIKVKWCYQNRKHYEDLGYKYTKNMDEFVVKTEHLTDGSNVYVTAICDICGKESRIKYQTYTHSLKSHGIYTCPKCGYLKTQLTNIERYGDISPLSNKEVIEKRKKTNLERYGVENLFEKDAPDWVKEKIKNTMIEKYGVDNLLKDTEFIKQKNIEKYGVSHHFKLESEKEKYLYGEKSSSYNPSIPPEVRISRRYLPENTKWRNAVFKRDNYTCKACGYDKGHIIQAHHIYSYTKYPEYRFEVHNGITLCKHCHKRFHDMYGYGNNDLDQFILFLLRLFLEGATTISEESTSEDELPMEAQNS